MAVTLFSFQVGRLCVPIFMALLTSFVESFLLSLLFVSTRFSLAYPAVIPKVVSHTDFKKRLSVGSGMSDTSGSMSSYCIGYDDPPAASSDGVHDSAGM